MQWLFLVLVTLCLCKQGYYKRILTLGYDELNPTNNLQNVLDPHLNKAVTYGFYTRQQADNLLQEVIQYNLEQYNIDFRTGFYNTALGSYHLPIATLYPYGTGYTKRHYLVLGDTAHPSRDNPQHPRVIIAAGYIAILNQTGIFPEGCRSAGYNFRKGDFLTTVQYLIVNNATFRKEETVKVYATVPTFQYLNALNQVEQYVTSDAIDEQGKKGTYIGSTQVLPAPEGSLLQVVRAIVTWDNNL